MSKNLLGRLGRVWGSEEKFIWSTRVGWGAKFLFSRLGEGRGAMQVMQLNEIVCSTDIYHGEFRQFSVFFGIPILPCLSKDSASIL